MDSRTAIVAVVALALGAIGCDDYYVDQSNTSGPWTGTEDAPFRTIQEGLNAAGRGDRVLVNGGYYDENVTMRRGAKLLPWEARLSPSVTIVGAAGAPVIRATGDNVITGLVIQGGSAGIGMDLGIALAGLSGERAEVSLTVRDCEIAGTHGGIVITCPGNLSFGSNNRRVVRPTIEHNWILKLSGSAVFSELIGPDSGSLQISLDIRDNVFQQTFTGVTLHAQGRGPNPGGYVRASYSGYITNNLMFGGTNGISLNSKNLADVGPIITRNTIVDNDDHGVVASADKGPDGQAYVSHRLIGNIIARNGGHGFMEFTGKTSPLQFADNLFFNNEDAHYFDYDTDRDISDQTGLNTPRVDNKTVFWSGSGNLVADPLFESGGFPWKVGTTVFSGANHYFLQQDGTTSPAVDAGTATVEHAGLQNRTTRTDLEPDVGIADIGFHYKKP